MNDLKELQDKVISLERLLRTHINSGSDLTQKLASTGRSYGGMVLAAGTTSVLPTGWTVSKSGTNIYTITHNLGTTSYSVVAQPLATDVDGGFNIDASAPGGANSFALDWYVGGVRSARDFNFVLIIIT